MTASASDDLAPILDSVRRFVAREVTPHVEDFEGSDEAPDHLVQQLGELGLFSLVVPEAFGGLGLPIESCARIMEVVAGGWTTLAGYLNSHATVAFLIATHGTEVQKRRFLPAMATGNLRGALTLTEPGAGSDLQAISTVAKPCDGGFRVTGTKVFVTNGRKAKLLLALVRTDPGAEPPARGMSLLLIDKATPGVTVGTETSKMAYRHVDTCEIHYDGALVPADCVLGETPGRGLSWLLDGLELGRIMIAASAVGLAQAALCHAVAYARTRVAFGQPIANHQAIQLELAGMVTKIEAARQLTWDAARHKQNSGRADMPSAMAKLFASETALEVCTSAMRIYGGYGYVKGFAVERLFREAPLYIVGEGTNEIQKLVIARRLLEQMA